MWWVTSCLGVIKDGKGSYEGVFYGRPVSFQWISGKTSRGRTGVTVTIVGTVIVLSTLGV